MLTWWGIEIRVIRFIRVQKPRTPEGYMVRLW